MSLLSVMTPDTFQTTLLAWVSAVSLVLLGVIAAVAAILPKVRALVNDITALAVDNTERLDRHRTELNHLQKEINDQNSPPPPSS